MSIKNETCYGVCGLYCDICPDKMRKHECHGCECQKKDCAAQYHQDRCSIYKCAKSKGCVTCADCDDMPCTQLIRFCYDPKARTHLPVIENLRRIRKIGLDQWIEEQKRFFEDDSQNERWLNYHDEVFGDS